MLRFTISTLIMVALLLATTIAFGAATPSLMNYQGQLADAGGTPLTGTYAMVWTIYDDPTLTVGHIIWQENHPSVSVANGLFSVILGSGTPAVPLTEAAFNAPDRWWGIKVGGDPEITPRARFSTVPYSQKVTTVDHARGGVVSGSITLQPSAKKEADNGPVTLAIEASPGDTTFKISPPDKGFLKSDFQISGGNLDLDSSSTASSGNIMKGGVLFIHNFGTDNTFIGIDAGNLTMGSFGNTANGSHALHNNTAGGGNTASGAYALLSNTTGGGNTAGGYFALHDNTIGFSNTAYGYAALEHNTLFDDNTAIGTYALNQNTIGQFNTACGSEALYHNTTGLGNTAAGSNALFSNTTGRENTAHGYFALSNCTSGIENMASGTSALTGNTTGSDNTASGFRALFGNFTGDSNNAYGAGALYNNFTGHRNTAIGASALVTNTTGNNNTAVGYGANVSTGGLTNATAIGYGTLVNASNKIRLGDTQVTVIEGQVAYTFTSDKNQKENFQPVDGDQILSKLGELGLSSWNYKGQDPRQFRHYGPMAQDFFAAFGHDGVGTSGTPTTINSGDEAGIMLIAIQALEKKNELMKAENAKIKSENTELMARFETTLATLQAEMATLRQELKKEK